MKTAKIFAPAKINLTLHVTGQRGDGYHLLDSLVAFADVGDWLTLKPAPRSLIQAIGPEVANLPVNESNLARQAIRKLAGEDSFELCITKNLPVSSGIGGGSADAAAAMRGVHYLKGLRSSPDTQQTTELGADVPMCVGSAPCRAQGIGDQLRPVTLPRIPAVLVNPRIPVSTLEVFKALPSCDNTPLGNIPNNPELGILFNWLRTRRNDLEQPAIGLVPEIASVLSALRSISGCQIARMSGSGATCFGLFHRRDSAIQASEVIKEKYPSWWVVPTILGDMSEAAQPVHSTDDPNVST